LATRALWQFYKQSHPAAKRNGEGNAKSYDMGPTAELPQKEVMLRMFITLKNPVVIGRV
jgi:hypothetical protein